MFEGPEYASYIELCCELRLEREFEEGDWFVFGRHEKGFVYSVLIPTHLPEVEKEYVWLPRLDQWLAMLHKAILHRKDHTLDLSWYYAVNGWAARVIDWSQHPEQVVERASFYTPEEAAGRLWKAVVDEIAQREGVTSY